MWDALCGLQHTLRRTLHCTVSLWHPRHNPQVGLYTETQIGLYTTQKYTLQVFHEYAQIHSASSLIVRFPNSFWTVPFLSSLNNFSPLCHPSAVMRVQWCSSQSATQATAASTTTLETNSCTPGMTATRQFTKWRQAGMIESLLNDDDVYWVQLYNKYFISSEIIQYYSYSLLLITHVV